MKQDDLKLQLQAANREIINLRQQNQQLQEQLKQVSAGGDFNDAIVTSFKSNKERKESVEQVMKDRKDKREKNFNKVATKKSKAPGHLKLELLNQILQEYPHLARPIVHIRLTESDLQNE
ncbi:hypothetical protein pb186bvf_014080 [Paramecium bursaria]